MKLKYLGVTEAHNIVLSNVQIGKIKTHVDINQEGCNGDHLGLLFDCGFSIDIEERGIKMRRTVRRPTHDHDDTEYLMVHKKTGVLKWLNSKFDNKDYDQAFIEFGPVTEK